MCFSDCRCKRTRIYLWIQQVGYWAWWSFSRRVHRWRYLELKKWYPWTNVSYLSLNINNTMIWLTFILIGNLPGKLVFLLVYRLPYWAMLLRNFFSMANDYEEVEEVKISNIACRCSITISEEYYQTHINWYHSSWVYIKTHLYNMPL